jgi:hypothetical protein
MPLLEALMDRNALDDLRIKSKWALKLIIEKCTEVEALQPLIDRAPQEVLKNILEQLAKLLPKNPIAQVPFFYERGLPVSSTDRGSGWKVTCGS